MRLDDALRSSGAVHIKGPKWCGKTETGIHHTRSQVYLQDPDKSPALLAMADSKPSKLLIGDRPRLIDEWQMAPQLWDAVRFAVDREKVRGGYVLTGSSTPKIRPAHTGVGRIAPLEMSTMSLLETGESTGAVSLLSLFEGTLDIAQVAGLDVDDYARVICRGGWPEAVVSESRGDAGRMARDYVCELLDSNINEMDGIRRNRTWMRQIMRSYARNVSGQASLSTIAADMQGEPPSAPTLSEYVDALSRAFVLNDLSAWNPRLRSKTAVRTSPTRHFSDPSIAAAVLAATPRGLLDDFETFGLLFESLCIHDLRVYASALGGSLYHYRDKTGLEADAVVVLDDGRWALVEITMGQSRIDEGASHLLKLAERIDQTREGRPSFLMVLTSTACAYRRKDGVVVVPLACLGV
jgi:AAA+ superfamily ATPase